eukprot:s1070_g18.t1
MILFSHFIFSTGSITTALQTRPTLSISNTNTPLNKYSYPHRDHYSSGTKLCKFLPDSTEFNPHTSHYLGSLPRGQVALSSDRFICSPPIHEISRFLQTNKHQPSSMPVP